MTTTNTQNVNITPVTTLVLYELGGDPGIIYRTDAFLTLTAGNISAAETTVRSKLSALDSVNQAFSMMYGKFTAGGGDVYDAALDAIGKITAIGSASVTLTTTGGVTSSYASGTSSGGSGGTSTGGPSISLSLTDPTTGAAVTSISTTNNALVKAIVYGTNGAVVQNAIVTFSTDEAYATFSGGANTALTNSSGAASVTLTTSNTSGGAAAVTASATVAGVTVTGSVNYAVGASALTLSAITLPSGTLSAYGTAGVSVNVLNNGALYTTPLTVKFTSACAASGKATLTSSVTTVNGTATASYLDNGCNNPNPGDTITATLSNGATVTGVLPVGSPSLGSIQYVSAVTNPATTPPTISLKGTGGLGKSESAQVTFKVVDNAGSPAGNTLVNFSLNTKLGGLTLSSTSATSDPTTGYVVTNVIAGTVSTAVRVTATTAGGLSTQSDQLVVSTGIPAQDSFSLSASTHNIEGWSYDGVTTTLTARLADHFKNPVPDGTAVSFTSEGGSVVASCNTTGGSCTSVFTSQNLRPTNGRVTVLARATGEEAFTDRNGNGTMDDASEAIDANSASTDMPEAFVDYNENGARDSNEPFFDFNGDGTYSAADGLYNGVLCTPGAAICSTQKSIDVRGSQVIVFSTSTPNITINGGNTIALPPCDINTGITPTNFIVTVVDANGNAMPAGTSVSFTTDNGVISSGANYTVPDTTGCRSGYAGCPASVGTATFGDRVITMKSDATWSKGTPPSPNTCTNTSPAGVFTVTVTTPKGVITSATATVTD